MIEKQIVKADAIAKDLIDQLQRVTDVYDLYSVVKMATAQLDAVKAEATRMLYELETI